ncbi:unnamed protein product [Durusdinium trenchii]|uniref:Uncharacterized protein n=1 Tax=Durusdinium trenchii TaxID=1381693 RepID=A0ABP0KXH0_9DINO
MEVTPGAQLFGFDGKALKKSHFGWAKDESSTCSGSPNSKEPRWIWIEDCDMLLNGECSDADRRVPKVLRSLVVRTSGGSHWKFESENGPLEEEQAKECHSIYPYSFYVRRHLVRQRKLLEGQGSEKEATVPSSTTGRGSSAVWTNSRVRFHAPNQPDWNALDNVAARSHVVLKPPGTWSHLNIYERALKMLESSGSPVDVGTDFFLVLSLWQKLSIARQNSGEPVIPQEIRQQTLKNFLAFKAETVGKLDINLDSTGLIRLPIAQLFPPPAPHWVWGSDRETDLDRLALYPRRKISLPNDPRIFEELLRCWLAPPLEFHFVYATQKADMPVAFQVEDVKELKTPLKEKRHDLFQRLKGWILCDADGLCLVALRETAAYFYENRLLFSDVRDPRLHEEKLQRIEALRCRFYQATDQVLAGSSGSGEETPGDRWTQIGLQMPMCTDSVQGDLAPRSVKVSRQFFNLPADANEPPVVIKEDYTLAAAFSGLGLVLCTLPFFGFGLGLLVLLLGVLFFVQAGRVRFVFDNEAFAVQTLSTGEELEKPGENIVVGGENRWKYSSFVNWEFFPKGLVEKGLPPVLVYFKETQTPSSEWNTGPGAAANSEEAMAKGAKPGQADQG